MCYESAKWRAYVLACFVCFRCLAFSCFLRARVLGVLYVLAWHARVLYEIGMLTCLACYIKWSAWRASKNGVLDEVKIDELFS